jgi:hypothetical protein
MSQVVNGFFGLLAASATFGAIQFASGSDLGSIRGDTRQIQSDQSVVNRAAKADRVALRVPTVAGTTLSFKAGSLTDTSVVIRLHSKPTNVETVNNGPASISVRPTSGPGRKSTVACEPVVSVLTEVAKHLQPGRCIT